MRDAAIVASMQREAFYNAIAHQLSLCEPTASVSVLRPTFVSNLFTTSSSGGPAGLGESAGANSAATRKTDIAEVGRRETRRQTRRVLVKQAATAACDSVKRSRLLCRWLHDNNSSCLHYWHLHDQRPSYQHA